MRVFFAAGLDVHLQCQAGEVGVGRPLGAVEGEGYQAGAGGHQAQAELRGQAVAEVGGANGRD